MASLEQVPAWRKMQPQIENVSTWEENGAWFKIPGKKMKKQKWKIEIAFFPGVLEGAPAN